MDSSSRKIELQSPEDFTYLINNVRRAATDSINAAFPPVEGADGQEDELRLQIEEMVNDYITRTFILASPSLLINGLPVSPSLLSSSSSSPSSPIVQYEPFNPSLRYRMESLARQEEDLLRSIASLKKKVPSTTASAYVNATKAGIATDEAALEAAREKVESEGRESGRKALEGVEDLERQGAVEEGFKGAVETLGRLKREMASTVAKMERARVAGGYVATEL